MRKRESTSKKEDEEVRGRKGGKGYCRVGQAVHSPVAFFLSFDLQTTATYHAHSSPCTHLPLEFPSIFFIFIFIYFATTLSLKKAQKEGRIGRLNNARTVQ